MRLIFLMACLVFFGFASFSYAGEVEVTPAQKAACYLRVIHRDARGNLLFQQGSGTLVTSRATPGVFVLTDRHVAEVFKPKAQVYVPGLGSFTGTEVSFDLALDSSLLLVDDPTPELTARAIVFEDIIADESAVPEPVVYNFGVPGGAVDTAPSRIPFKDVKLARYAFAPGLQIVDLIFFDAAKANPGQSGALAWTMDGKAIGILFANAKLKGGGKGLLVVPFTAVKASVGQYLAQRQQIAVVR